MKKPSLRKILRSVLFTVLPAAAILIVGCLLLIGAHAFLPQYTGQYKEYSIDPTTLLPAGEDGDGLTLYPWNELTFPYNGAFGVGDMEDALYGWNIPLYELNLDHAEYLFNREQTVLGIRNITYYPYSPSSTEVDQDTYISHEPVAYTLSVALNQTFGICYLHAERERGETEEKVLQSGYEQLCAQAKIPFNTDYSPFYLFYQWFSAQTDSYLTDGVIKLLYDGAYSSFLYQGEAYFCYADSSLSMTLIIDASTCILTGFSLEQL